MEGKLESSCLRLTRIGTLWIGNDYINKYETCDCGNQWSHVLMWQNGSFLPLCESCKDIGIKLFPGTKSYVRDDLFMAAQRTQKHNPKAAMWSFWEQSVLQWIRTQEKPVTIIQVATQFNRQYKNTSVSLKKLTDMGKLRMIVTNSKTNEKAFMVKEN